MFSYLHSANPGLGKLTRALMDRKMTAIAYETVQLLGKTLPLLEPISKIVERRMRTLKEAR